MARSTTTRLQLSGHRFLVRRMAHALVRGDVRMLDDPLRTQSLALAAGCVLAAVAVAACAILAVIQPAGALGAAPIVMVRESGALYVRIGDTLHPVLNLASARLIAGTPATPQLVKASAVEAAKRGPLVGIPGAPDTIADPLTESHWAVCEDATSTTTVIAGEAADRRSARLLVSARGESAATTYLLYDGRRAEVDLRNHAVVRALGLDDTAPRPVSRALIDTVPAAPPIQAPVIAKAGAAGPARLHGFTVGTVVRLNRAEAAEYYVVLADGVQRVGEVAADLIRFTQPSGRREVVTVAPAAIGTLPIVDELPVATFPEHRGVTHGPVVCAHWEWSHASGPVTTAVSVTDSPPLAAGAAPVTLAQADDAGPAVDRVVMPRGRSAYVRAVGITGAGADSGALYLVNGSGVLFGIEDEAAAKRLGLTTAPAPAPWPVLARLPRGPELSVDGASVVRDSGASPS